MEAACVSLSQLGILLLGLLSGGSSADESARGLIGRDVTLTCRYDARYYGTLAACWGKGVIPNSGCGSEMIRSDGSSVTSRESERYVMRGDLSQGDVSLTIRQLQESDAGTYGCRVDIPGWFNDHKHHVTLTVQPGPPDPVRLELEERRSRMVVLRWSPGFDGGIPLTSYTLQRKDISGFWSSAAVRTTTISPRLSRTTVTDLQPFSTYNIRMFAKNAVGDSTESNTLTVTTREEAPGGPPLNVQVEALSSRSLQISWGPPRPDLHHGVIQRYIVAYRLLEKAPSVPWTTTTVYSTGRPRQKLVVSGLSPATMYAVGVQAVNGEGGGPVSPQLLYSTLEDEYSTTMSFLVTDSTDIDRLDSTSTAVQHMDTTSAASEMVTVSTNPQIVWEPTEVPEDQSEVRSLSTESPQSTTFSNQVEPIISGDEVQSQAETPRLVGIVVPVVLVALLVGMAVLWQLKRMKDRKANLEISWKNNGSLAFSETRLISDL